MTIIIFYFTENGTNAPCKKIYVYVFLCENEETIKKTEVWAPNFFLYESEEIFWGLNINVFQKKDLQNNTCWSLAVRSPQI